MDKSIARQYDVLLGTQEAYVDTGEEDIETTVGGDVTLRGSFLIDDEGTIRHSIVNDLPLGRINMTTQSGRANESPTNANYRGVGLAEMLYCIENGINHRCNGELSLHVLDIIKSTMKAADSRTTQDIKTSCQKADYFTLEEIQKILK